MPARRFGQFGLGTSEFALGVVAFPDRLLELGAHRADFGDVRRLRAGKHLAGQRTHRIAQVPRRPCAAEHAQQGDSEQRNAQRQGSLRNRSEIVAATFLVRRAASASNSACS